MVSVKTKSELIAEVNGLLGAVGDRFDVEMTGNEDGDAERDFMVHHCPKRLEATIRSLPAASMHLLSGIAAGPVSVVGLAERSGRLKGTVSKHVQRLVGSDLVRRTPLPGNRKEVELTLTRDGKLVCDAHRRLHDEMTSGLSDFLQAYANDDLEVIATVLRDLAAADRNGVRLARASARSERIPRPGSAR